jgi:hypothetical protein
MFDVAVGSRIAALVAVFAVGAAWGAEVRFKAIDLPDAAAGQDLWELQYTALGDFPQFDGLTLVYAADKFSDLALAQPPDPTALAPTLVQPGFGADGLLSLTAERAIAGETHRFGLSFVWLAAGVPGAQPFEVFDGSSLAVTQSGVTQAVPEPQAVGLLLFGLAALAARRRWPSPRSVRS